MKPYLDLGPCSVVGCNKGRRIRMLTCETHSPSKSIVVEQMSTYKIVYALGGQTFKLKFQAKNDEAAKARAKQFSASSLGRELRVVRLNGLLVTEYELIRGLPLC